jgi:hypothetical protein
MKSKSLGVGARDLAGFHVVAARSGKKIGRCWGLLVSLGRPPSSDSISECEIWPSEASDIA